MAAGTRIVKGKVERPDGKPWSGKTVTARLNTIAFIDDGTASPTLTTEIIREAYATTDATGTYSLVLTVSADITQPSGTSYTVRVAGDSSELTIQVPAGDPVVPVWVFSCLVADPTNPNPIDIGITEARLEAYALPLAQKNAASGVAGLDTHGLLWPFQVPGVYLIPPPTGDLAGADQTMVQTLLDNAAANFALTGATGPCEVRCQAGNYWVTDLRVNSGVTFKGAGTEGWTATRIRSVNGSNKTVVRTVGFENTVIGRLNTGIVAGSTVTSVSTTPLTHAVLNGDSIQLASGAVSLTASAGAAIGATSISVSSATVGPNVDANAGVLLNPSVSVSGGFVQGFQVLDMLIDGNSDHNTSGNGMDIYGARYTVHNVFIYQAAGIGFFSAGANGSTGSYPYGQVENTIGTLSVAQTGGVGVHYEGIHDGYCKTLFIRSCGGNGAEISGLDGDYCHTYGNQIGFLFQGNAHWNTVESENNFREAISTNGVGSVTNTIGEAYCYGNWVGGTTPDKFAINLTYRVDIGMAHVNTNNGESGIYVQGNGQRIGYASLTGTGSATPTIGLSISANEVDISAHINLYNNTVQRYGNNSRVRVFGTNSNFGWYEPDQSGTGNILEYTFRATGSGQVPWTLATPSGVPGNTYRFVSTDQVVKTFFRDASGQQLTVPTAIKTGAYTAAVGDLVLCDVTSSAYAITLPTAPGDGARIDVKVVKGTPTSGVLSHTLTVNAGGSDHFNTTDGATSLTITSLRAGFRLQYTAATSTWQVSPYADIGQLDARYAAVGASGITRVVATVTSSATLGAVANTDYVAFVGTSGAPTLPTAVGNANRYTVKNIRGTNVTLATTSSQTIDGSTSATLTPNTSLDLVSDGANWRVV